MVIDAVKDLVDNSGAVIDFMNDTVLPDYESFAANGQRYRVDALHESGERKEFVWKTEKLNELTLRMSNYMEGISEIIGQSSAGIGRTAKNIGCLVQEMQSVNHEMETNRQIVVSLRGETDRFANL